MEEGRIEGYSVSMRILLTGNNGLIGKVLEGKLRDLGHKIVGFDLTNGQDICNVKTVVSVGKNCDAVVHLAALLGNNEKESAEEILRTNLLGTWNVLESARINSMHKVIFVSSVDALGLFKGEGVPDYFPIDDNHPCRPATPYAISKKLSEEMCRSFSQTNNIPTICLRPPGVWNQQIYSDIIEARKKRPEYEWDPFWEYGAFIDVKDLTNLVVKCLESDFTGYDCYLVSSDDITTSGKTSIELARKIYPEVKWKSQVEFKKSPYKSLLDCHRVKEKFGWKPEYTWKKFVEGNTL